ncbi:MAG TPA: endolytic transglycosylase MltG [Candidatus Baltobacteraceae bacterium]|jgi:UPF0755 protein|nr:endolytic transglycosylase MltG [Candidatus Baltobacteraceae bacterium]
MKKRWLALFVTMFFLVVCGMIGIVLLDRSFPDTSTLVDVPVGANGSEIARLLAQRGVVRSALTFEGLERVLKLQDQLRAGEYRFSAHETPLEILRQVTTEGAQLAVWVTIPEGFTARDISALLAQHGIGSEEAFARYFLDTATEIDGVRTKNFEGFLFPDTYLIPVGATPEQIAQIMTDQFRAELRPDALARAHVLGLTLDQVVTIASMIEREARFDDERRLMAGVYENRLRARMPLQVDATLEYLFSRHHAVITEADLHVDSPYNTYRSLGLPPTPIANPGKPSLDAAFDPQPTEYLYYVSKGNGRHAFSRTLAEHQANVARYLR